MLKDTPTIEDIFVQKFTITFCSEDSYQIVIIITSSYHHGSTGIKTKDSA